MKNWGWINLRFGIEEINAVREVIESGQLSSFFREFRGGLRVQQFEKEFAEYLGVKHAISVSNGTAALHTALLACDIGFGDEVLVPPYTFVSTASSVLMAGGYPKFIDVDPKTYTMAPREIARNISTRTKAIIPVSLLGHPADMDAIREEAHAMKKDIKIIEDAAQALGAKYKGRMVGTLANCSCFSFQESKTITSCGEGGMVVTDDDRLAERCQSIRNHGEYYSTSDIMGFNYRMTEIQAAFGTVQLRKLPNLLREYGNNAKIVMGNLPKGITPPYVSPDVEHSWYIIGCQIDEEELGVSKDKLVAELQTQYITHKRPGYVIGGGYSKPIYDWPYYQKWKRVCPVAERLIPKSFWMDIHRFKDADAVRWYMNKLDSIVEAIKRT